MKKRNVLFALCLAFLLSALSPMALASSPETDTPVEPLDPEPYKYISSIYADLEIDDSRTASCYCSVYIPDTTKWCDLTMALEQSSDNGATWSEVTRWTTTSGISTTTYLDETYPNTPVGYRYRLEINVLVYQKSNNYLCEDRSIYSNAAF